MSKDTPHENCDICGAKDSPYRCSYCPDYYEIPAYVYDHLHDFIMERQSDIEMDMEDLGMLDHVLNWIRKVEENRSSN